MKTRLPPSLKRALLAELNRRHKQGRATRELHAAQQRALFAKDANGNLAQFVHWCAPRRSGKSEGYYRYAGDRAQAIKRYRAAGVYQYLADAKEIGWQILLDLAEKYEWDCEFNKSELRVTFRATGGFIKLFGLDEERRHGRVRGPKWHDLLVDEAQGFFTDLRKLVEAGIMASLGDFYGRIFLFGTPGDYSPELRFFGQIHIGAKGTEYWTRVRSTAWENPHTAPQLQQLLDQITAANPDATELPWVRREYFGEWAIDNRELVIPIGTINYVTRWRPHVADKYLLTIDWGANRNGLLVSCHNTQTMPYSLYLEAKVLESVTTNETVAAIRDYQARYPGLAIVADPGGIASQIRTDLERVHRLPLIKADKLNREGAIKVLRTKAALGQVRFFNRADAKVLPDGTEVSGTPEMHLLARRWRELVYVEKGGKREEGRPRELHDCALYADRHMYAHNYSKQKPAPKHGTPEWYAEQEQRWRDEAAQRNQRQTRGDW